MQAFTDAVQVKMYALTQRLRVIATEARPRSGPLLHLAVEETAGVGGEQLGERTARVADVLSGPELADATGTRHAEREFARGVVPIEQRDHLLAGQIDGADAQRAVLETRGHARGWQELP